MNNVGILYLQYLYTQNQKKFFKLFTELKNRVTLASVLLKT